MIADVPQSACLGSCTNLTPRLARSRQVAITSSATKEIPVKLPIRSCCPGGVNSAIPAPDGFGPIVLVGRHPIGRGAPSVHHHLSSVAAGEGFSKRAGQEALRCLARRRLLSRQAGGVTAIPVYTVKRPWARG